MAAGVLHEEMRRTEADLLYRRLEVGNMGAVGAQAQLSPGPAIVGDQIARCCAEELRRVDWLCELLEQGAVVSRTQFSDRLGVIHRQAASISARDDVFHPLAEAGDARA